MWPGQQPPGGEQNPNPYQQPGYQQQPNPYQQPGYQQPSPYQQPGYQQPPAQWQQPAGPGGPHPPKDNRKRTQTIAIVCAVAVVAAAAVTGVLVLQGDGSEDDTAKKDTRPSASPSPSRSSGVRDPGGSPGADNPRGGSDVEPVVKGWQPVVNAKRQNVFDVPEDWTVESQGTSIGFTDDKDTSDFPKPLVVMSAPAFYEEDWCTVTKDGYDSSSSLAGTGTKGAQGAKSTAEAAENEALNWVYAAYDQKKTGSFDSTDAKPFTSDHGITGHSSSATVTGVKKQNKCGSDGKAFTVSYKADNGDLATWVLYAAKGVKDEVPDETIRKIMSTLRPLESGQEEGAGADPRS